MIQSNRPQSKITTLALHLIPFTFLSILGSGILLTWILTSQHPTSYGATVTFGRSSTRPPIRIISHTSLSRSTSADRTATSGSSTSTHRTSTPFISSSWFARPGESFPEGERDKNEMLEQKRQESLESYPLKQIDYLIALGSTAKKLRLSGLHFHLAASSPSVQHSPHWESGNFHLSKSEEVGDPYWYLSKGGTVSKKGNGRQHLILAYQQGERTKEGQMLDPFQPGAHFNWWVKGTNGGWMLPGEESLNFVAVLVRERETKTKTKRPRTTTSTSTFGTI